MGGCDGHVSVKWKTGDITAVDKKDYIGGEEELKFDNQETSKTIDIELKPGSVSKLNVSPFIMHGSRGASCAQCKAIIGPPAKHHFIIVKTPK